MATGPGHNIGYNVFDKLIKLSLLLEEIMGTFFAPLYFLGAVLPFALVFPTLLRM